MMIIKLEVVDEYSEENKPVRERKAPPIWTGNGDIDYICGNCEAVIAKSMRMGQIKNLKLDCPTCGKLIKSP